MNRELIHNALRQRLSEVETLLNEPVGDAITVSDSDDSEEKLRVVMVRLFPKVQQGKASADDAASYCEQLEQLMKAALTEDWRFLDAWNNAFEVIHAQQRLFTTEQKSNVYRQYGFLLKSHLKNA